MYKNLSLFKGVISYLQGEIVGTNFSKVPNWSPEFKTYIQERIWDKLVFTACSWLACFQ